MRFFTLFAGALVATTAANILLASDAYAGFPPNGWSQVGKSCDKMGNHPAVVGTRYHKLKKNDGSTYGVYRNKKTWQQKGIGEGVANAKMNSLCYHNSYCTMEKCYGVDNY